MKKLSRIPIIFLCLTISANLAFSQTKKAVPKEPAPRQSGRRSFASGMGAKGISLCVLMWALRHKDIGTTIKYIDASDDLVRNPNTVALAS